MPHEEAQTQQCAAISPSPAMTDLDREQIRVERLKAWLTAGSIIASVGAAILTYLSAQWVQRQETAAAFRLKAAEIVMTSRTPWEAQGKARALATFFQDRVPPSMTDDEFDPAKHGWGRESHRELLRLLLTSPATSSQHRAMVMETWKAFFPGDTWVNDIPPLL